MENKEGLETKKPLISVIVPIYNTEKYLTKCLESIVNQTVSFNEIILINDGSTDNSLEICKVYADKYKNIKLINQNNKGLAATRNRGIKCSTSDWVIFVDSDDLIENNLVEIISKELTKNKYDVLFYNACICNDIKEREYSSVAYVRGNQMYGKEFTGMDFFINSYKDKLIVSACCAVYNRNFLIKYKIDFPAGYYFEDNYFFIKVVTNARKVKCISDRLYIRRYREDSITVSDITKKKCNDLMQIYILIAKYIFEKEYTCEEVAFLKQYIFNNYIYTSRYIESFIEDEEIRSIFHNFGVLIENYLLGKSDQKILNWNDLVYLFSIYTRIEKIFGEKKISKELKSNLEKSIKRKLSLLNLNDKTKRIGIYGLGKHTEALIKLYKQYMGDVNCDLFYIVTETDQCSFKGKPLYSVKNLSDCSDKIIISSLIYQQEMYQNLLNAGINRENIILMYSKEEIIDITWMTSNVDIEQKEYD